MKKSGTKLPFDVRKLAAGLCYLLLCGVVVYGMDNHVYDGFGNTVPWLIILIFAVMAIIRIVESIAGAELARIIELVLGKASADGSQSEEADAVGNDEGAADAENTEKSE